MLFDITQLTDTDRHKLLIGAVVPRPIAWVSTIDAVGVPNVAPFSFFTVVCDNPMTLLFCPGVTETNDGKKDTLRNIEAIPEFVVNLTNVATATAMNLTATPLPPGHSEFTWAGLTPAPSQMIRPPRVAEAPIAFECKLQRIVTVSDQPGGGAAVFGEVQCVYVRDDLYANGRILLEAYQPIGRLGGNNYVRVMDTFAMERVLAPKTSG
ncbi:MAG: flavin reductase family protein [Caldilineaceae bacterium]